jgi:hypothetical protein
MGTGMYALMSLEKSNLLYFHTIIGFFPIKCNYFDKFKGLVCGIKTAFWLECQYFTAKGAARFIEAV